MSDVTAFVLAGGGSRRMGRDKALLPWTNGTLLDHAISRLRQVTPDVRILCGPEPRYVDCGLPVVVDAVTKAGSLGGVYSGVRAMTASLGLFLGVDLPLVTPLLLRRLVEMASGFDAVVPFSDAGPEPLCAVYAGTCLEPIRRAIEKGTFKMTAFWPEARVREVRGELAGLGDVTEMFLNVNAPGDYERALAEG